MYFIYLKELQRERDRERERPPVFWFTLQMAGLEAWSFMWVSYVGSRAPGTWAIFHWLPRLVDRELDRQWGSGDLNWRCTLSFFVGVVLPSPGHMGVFTHTWVLLMCGEAV